MDITHRDEYIFSMKPNTYLGKETFHMKLVSASHAVHALHSQQAFGDVSVRRALSVSPNEDFF